LPGEGFALSGAIPDGAAQKYWRSLKHPTVSAARSLRALLLQGGIRVDGAAGVQAAPPASQVLWQHRSAPLADIIKHMAYDSDNHKAEQLLHCLGRRVYGVGTLDNGLAAERRFLKNIGAWDAGTRLIDGSGLSTADRISAHSLAAVLRWMLSGPDASRIARVLPRIGVDGTTRWRAIAPDARGKVVGKDGYIAGASGLAGYVQTAHHGVLAYAFLVDDWRFGLYNVWRAEDDLLAELSRL
jgi:D-alanyl-D-alanine carboxypeptidase/D-alanyl-D-alanine-endopeptidase (penicillin-binding protein 4)